MGHVHRRRPLGGNITNALPRPAGTSARPFLAALFVASAPAAHWRRSVCGRAAIGQGGQDVGRPGQGGSPDRPDRTEGGPCGRQIRSESGWCEGVVQRAAHETHKLKFAVTVNSADQSASTLLLRHTHSASSHSSRISLHINRFSGLRTRESARRVNFLMRQTWPCAANSHVTRAPPPYYL